MDSNSGLPAGFYLKGCRAEPAVDRGTEAIDHFQPEGILCGTKLQSVCHGIQFINRYMAGFRYFFQHVLPDRIQKNESCSRFSLLILSSI
jgi:hypothetical protein